MKNYVIIVLSAISFLVNSQSVISKKLRGMNGWMPPDVGSSADSKFVSNPNFPTNVNGSGYKYIDNLVGGKFVINDLNLKIMRFGGLAHDVNRPTLSQYMLFISEAKKLKAEPLVQISILNDLRFDKQQMNNNTVLQTAMNFTASSYFTNIINNIKNDVKFYSISCEPDQWTKPEINMPVTVAEIGRYFRTIASAIKILDPDAIVCSQTNLYF